MRAEAPPADLTVAGSSSDAAGAVSLAGLIAAIGEDVELLAALHDREPTKGVIEAVRSGKLQDQFGLVLTSEAGVAGLSALERAAGALPIMLDAATINELAAGYADVYLRFTYRASPAESVWLTEDGLERQGPMFSARNFYRRHGLKVVDAEGRADDHIVIELRFLAHLLAKTADDGAALEAATRFLDQHLLRWVKLFAERLIERGAPDWYAALALLTAAYLDELRGVLVLATGLAVPDPAAIPVRSEPDDAPMPETRYVPGTAPSW